MESADLLAAWIKLVAHGVPILPDQDILALFVDEARTFNSIKVLGAPRWLTSPEGKKHGSIIFVVEKEEEKA